MTAHQTPLPIERQTYTPREAARILGVSHQTVTRMVHEGKLPSIDVGSTRRLVIPMWAVDRLVAPPETVTIDVAGRQIVDPNRTDSAVRSAASWLVTTKADLFEAVEEADASIVRTAEGER